MAPTKECPATKTIATNRDGVQCLSAGNGRRAKGVPRSPCQGTGGVNLERQRAPSGDKTIATNREARHGKSSCSKALETGVELKGKGFGAWRAGGVNLKDS